MWKLYMVYAVVTAVASFLTTGVTSLMLGICAAAGVLVAVLDLDLTMVGPSRAPGDRAPVPEHGAKGRSWRYR